MDNVIAALRENGSGEGWSIIKTKGQFDLVAGYPAEIGAEKALVAGKRARLRPLLPIRPILTC